MVKIMDFNCVRNFWLKVIVHMFSLIYHYVLCMNHYVLVVVISASDYTMATSEKYESFKTPNQPEWWKTTLKYKNLFSLTYKIPGSYMPVFTVLRISFTAKNKRHLSYCPKWLRPLTFCSFFLSLN